MPKPGGNELRLPHTKLRPSIVRPVKNRPTVKRPFNSITRTFLDIKMWTFYFISKTLKTKARGHLVVLGWTFADWSLLLCCCWAEGRAIWMVPLTMASWSMVISSTARTISRSKVSRWDILTGLKFQLTTRSYEKSRHKIKPIDQTSRSSLLVKID